MIRRRTIPTAFTTIELLVAISILVILAGLVFVGYRSVGGSSQVRLTRTTLESMKSMLAETDAGGGMANVKTIYTSRPTPPNNFFPPLATGTPTPLAAPNDGANQRGRGNISLDTYSTTRTIRFTALPIVLTQQVMGRLVASPTNRTILGQIPAERLLKGPGSPLPTGVAGQTVIAFNPLPPAGNGEPNPPIVVDAWGNPIIYVPPSGLSGVFFEEQPTTERVITSTRVRGLYSSGDSNPQSQTYGNFDPAATGFWASAGPDGDFTTGDDNLYSFE